MFRIWGVDTLTGLGRIFEAVSLVEVNLSNLDSRVSELDEWNEHLPVDEAQHVRESAARVQPIRNELNQLFADIGNCIHCAYHICDDTFHEVYEIDGVCETYPSICQFNREQLLEFTARLVIVLTKATTLAIEINQQAQALVTSKYPDYEVSGEDATVMSGYGEGHMMWVQELDGSEETGELSEVLQCLVNYSGEDASNLRYLLSFVEQQKQALEDGKSAKMVVSSDA